MKRFWLVWLFWAVLLVACGGSGSTALQVSPGETFTLGVDDTVRINGVDWQIRFEGVPEDSRCPTNVECFWTGEAKADITILPAAGEPVAGQFNTNPAPDMHQDTVVYSGYTIQMQSLDPYPQDPDSPIHDDEYRLTLTITQE